MRRSETFGQISAALARAQAAYTPVPKNKTATVKTHTGGEYSYKYADLADCLQMALPLLAKNGIAFLQPHELTDGKLRVTTLLAHESGEWMQSDGTEISEDGTPQQFGSESSYFRRYDGCSFIGVSPDEDTDAQQAGDRTRRTPASVISHNPPQSPQSVPQSQGTQTVTESAKARVAAAQAQQQAEQGHFAQFGENLECVIKAVTEKESKKGTYLLVTFNGRVDGFNYASVWHKTLNEALLGAVNKPAVLKLSKKMSDDGKSVKFLNVEDVFAIDGIQFKKGKPDTLTTALTEPMEVTNNDIPF